MLSINTNLSSLIAQSSMNNATNKLNQAIERMTTGYKINHASDNAANYSISTNMTTKINSYMVAEDNCAMGLDMITTAGESLGQIGSKFTRLRDLATQAGNGTYGATSLNAINSEANALVDEIQRLYSTAEYNGIKLFGGNAAGANGVSAASEPAGYALANARATTNTTYTDEEIAEMTTITEAKAAGSFTTGETYSINSVQELQDFRDMVNTGQSGEGATFVLAKDLDLSGINWTPIGTYDESNSLFNDFEGSFNGNGNVISHLTMDRTLDYCGFFGAVYASSGQSVTIQNVGLEDVNIKGHAYATGALVGRISNASANIILCNNYVTGDVSGTDCVGGLVGYAYSIGDDTTNNIFEHNYVVASVIAEGDKAGGLFGEITNESSVFNFTSNYATGDVTGIGDFVGGLIGTTISDFTMIITNNYATNAVSGQNTVGGLVGRACSYDNMTLSNNYSTGFVTGTSSVSGLVGDSSGMITYNDNASVQADNNATQMTAEEIAATYTPESMGFTEANGWRIVDGQPVLAFSMAARNANSGGGVGGSNYITLQVGIQSNEHSRIGLELGFTLEGVDDLRMIGLDTTTDYLTQLDNMLSTINAKEVEYGAAQNRLESALDEISIQYENLVSSRSTIRDADIAQVSSQYIQQQILQQAAATLLATANQSPSIALQLI